MFRATEGFSGFSVDDLGAAERFYTQTLGLEMSRVEDMGDMLAQLTIAPGVKVLVYAKADHQPATFTVLNLTVPDIDKGVEELAAEGVAFEHYEGEVATDGKGIFRYPGGSIAWFRDPAGNILSLIQQD